MIRSVSLAAALIFIFASSAEAKGPHEIRIHDIDVHDDAMAARYCPTSCAQHGGMRYAGYWLREGNKGDCICISITPGHSQPTQH